VDPSRKISFKMRAVGNVIRIRRAKIVNALFLRRFRATVKPFINLLREGKTTGVRPEFVDFWSILSCEPRWLETKH